MARFVDARRDAELEQIIAEEGSNPRRPGRSSRAFRDGAIQTTGTAITKILPPVSRFATDGGHGSREEERARQTRSVLRPVLRTGLKREAARGSAQGGAPGGRRP